jgi:drug/metabolite transporter (DMT)-like permease
MNTPISSMAWVLLGSFIGSFGAVLLKAGAKRLERNLLALFKNWRLAAGVSAYILSSVFFVLGLRNGELSILYPMVSLSYIWTVFWSKTFFGEKLTSAKFYALGLILFGVALLGLGTR